MGFTESEVLQRLSAPKLRRELEAARVARDRTLVKLKTTRGAGPCAGGSLYSASVRVITNDGSRSDDSMASPEEAEEGVQPTSDAVIDGDHQGVRQRLPSQDLRRQRRRRFAGSVGGGRSSGSYLRRLRENLRKPVGAGSQRLL